MKLGPDPEAIHENRSEITDIVTIPTPLLTGFELFLNHGNSGLILYAYKQRRVYSVAVRHPGVTFTRARRLIARCRAR